MKLYADSILELGQDLILFPDMGFAAFKIEKTECSLVNIFVDKDLRQQKIASRMIEDIASIAKRRGCTVLKGTVSLISSRKSDVFTKFLLSNGFIETASNGLIFTKDI